MGAVRLLLGSREDEQGAAGVGAIRYEQGAAGVGAIRSEMVTMVRKGRNVSWCS